ncbi:hypothetical protein CEUSTIGMA_g12703.t1 [Chlamydomonas eustigma]|uniref:Peptidase A1 domain-containing protein n=1 Tax=Chlamydomonas eustigma TaxID=1157962 RepID=A0A250XQG4_9CHLO|nr:hypothetical protein CEUSTIGMA_g12703.t1 [Chlamydomonas eustigma]|eukprot:GAX85286.1 hypothetical protein CEUSTIGMA_g12703.t1 [Chlamydomonas eustigma]
MQFQSAAMPLNCKLKVLDALLIVAALLASSLCQGYTNHPKVLTHVGDGVVAGALYRHHRNKSSEAGSSRRHLSSSFVPETTAALGLGEYTLQLLLDGDVVNAVLDTVQGSGLIVYNPNTANPPFTLVQQGSTTCNALCPHTNGCLTSNTNPAAAVAGACEYTYAYGGGNYLYGRVSTT